MKKKHNYGWLLIAMLIVAILTSCETPPDKWVVTNKIYSPLNAKYYLEVAEASDTSHWGRITVSKQNFDRVNVTDTVLY